MGKYVSRAEFEKEAPKAWAEYTDPDAYESGMNVIAPAGKKLKSERKAQYGEHTTEKEAAKWLKEFDRAMFE